MKKTIAIAAVIGVSVRLLLGLGCGCGIQPLHAVDAGWGRDHVGIMPSDTGYPDSLVAGSFFSTAFSTL